MRDEGILGRLTHGDLDTVSFVRDYVEMRIDYNVVRCITGSIVRTKTGDFRFPEPGSRDALCGLINGIVMHVEVTADAINLHLESDEALVLPLDEESRTLARRPRPTGGGPSCPGRRARAAGSGKNGDLVADPGASASG